MDLQQRKPGARILSTLSRRSTDCWLTASLRWKSPAEEAGQGQSAQLSTPTKRPASAPAPATGEEAAPEVTAVEPLLGCTAAVGTGGDGEAVRPAVVPRAEDSAGGEVEEEEGGEGSGGTAGAAPTSRPAVPIRKEETTIL